MQEFLFGDATKTIISLALLVVLILIVLWARNMRRTRPPVTNNFPIFLGEGQIFYRDAAGMPEPFPVNYDQRKWQFDSESGMFSFPGVRGNETEIQLGSSDVFVATCDTGIPVSIGKDKFQVTLRRGERVLSTWQASDFDRMPDLNFPLRVMYLNLTETKQVLIVAGIDIMITAERL